MLNSIATVSISGTLEEKLRAIAHAKFEGVEIFENDLLTCTSSAREIGGMVRDLNLKCTVFQPFRDFEGMPDKLRQRVFDRAERKFDVMQDLGTDLVLICSNVSPAALSDRSRIVADFQELGERAAKRGLRIGYEALAWGKHIWDHRDAWAVVKEVNHPAVGLILDTFHSLARAVPIESLRWIDAEKIFLVQIADAPQLTMDPLYWSRHFRCMPNQGDFPLVEYVKTLADIGYKEALSLEIFNDRFRAASTSAIALDGKRSLVFLQEQVQQQINKSAQQDTRAVCNGVEFIEFCVSEEESKTLGILLESLGFIATGQHVSKAVTRWLQGNINLVVNCETEGFAHTYHTIHGAAVCAIGLRVVDVAASLKRADELQISTFSQAVGYGEMEIPAVQGVGGSLIYFVDEKETEQVWSTEFISFETDKNAGEAGLLHIDHVAQTMQFEEMLTWVLYYFSFFDIAKTPQIEISDPSGLVASQALQSADGNFRITLNGSAASQTLASRFLNTYLGAGVQHIAFATHDIFVTARKLRDLKMEFLPIPPNYYDDVDARFGLDEDLIKRLAEFNILYDRDENGEYFQLYSRAFAKRFFFEIVERRNYDGYGAANAGMRLAAQSRYKVESL